jgi:hypothetical protein
MSNSVAQKKLATGKKLSSVSCCQLYNLFSNFCINAFVPLPFCILLAA